MKNLTLFLMALVISINMLKGQGIPNSGFENWTNFVVYEQPESWNTSNKLTFALGIFCVEKEAQNPYEGNYSVKLTTKSAMAGSITIPGYLTLGDFTFDMTTQEVKNFGGIAFNKKPDKLSLYYKYLPAPGDKWFIAVEFFYRDSTNGEKHTIGGATAYFADSTPEWTLLELPLNFQPGAEPDSLNINILSSNPDSPLVGSVLYLDKLYFDYPDNINEEKAAEIRMYPNPCHNTLYFTENDTEMEWLISDISGKTVMKGVTRGNSEGLDISKLNQGYYLLKIKNTSQQNWRLYKFLKI